MEEADKKLTLLDLSDDSIYLILSRLGIIDLKSAALTNKTFRNIIEENQIFQRDFVGIDNALLKIDLRGWTFLRIKEKYKNSYFDLKISGYKLIYVNQPYYTESIQLSKDYYIYNKDNKVIVINENNITILLSIKNRISTYIIDIDYQKVRKILLGYDKIYIIYLDNKVIVDEYLGIKGAIFELVHLSPSLIHIRNDKFDQIYLIYNSTIILTFSRGRKKDIKWKYLFNYLSYSHTFKEANKYINKNRNDIDYNILEEYVERYFEEMKQKRSKSSQI